MYHKFKPMTSTINQIQNYNGNNSFILKMKEVIKKYNNLTPNQEAAAKKILSAFKDSKSVEMSEDMKRIANYQGENSFVKEIKSKLEKYGRLSYKQQLAAITQIENDIRKENTHKLNIPTVGETIKIGRSIGQKMKEQYGLKFNPILLDITKVLAVSPKAVKFSGKLTIKRGDVCTCCMKTLTDEFSMLTGMGKICASHVGVTYITDKSQTEKFREEYMKRVEEIGEMEFWVPKSKIVKWEGKTGVILKMI